MKKALLLLILAALFIPTLASAASLPGISYQGKLTDDKGRAVPNGKYEITVELYDSASEGKLLWENAYTVLTQGGLFNLTLGNESNPLPEEIFRDNVWLELIVNDEPLLPRQPLLSSPFSYYALHADSVDSLDTNSVTTHNIVDGTIQAADLAPGAVAADAVADSAVTSAKIADGEVQTADLAYAAVTSEKIANGSITGTDIHTGTLTSENISDYSIQEQDIASNAVISRTIASRAVTPQKLDFQGAMMGEVLTCTGASVAWMPPPIGIDLPYSDSVGSIEPALSITNTGPGEAAHFGGDVHVDGKVTVAEALRCYSMPACSFRSTNEAYANCMIGANHIWGRTAGSIVTLRAPVHLPDGAAIKELRIRYTDDSSAEDLNFLLGYTDDVSLKTIAFVETSGTPGTANLVKTGLSHTVDNFTNAYYCEVSWRVPSSPEALDDLMLRNVKIHYAISSLP